ncbi:GEVED domain-containing protein [candidate division CSSED10-310 bacterium]|uniref:GEVED domain-containing protein n=1 Tax=candidate division CSSED10-310 bacterium TaxID=2855610 RepID=A0ABV6Z2P9_UNCC1
MVKTWMFYVIVILCAVATCFTSPARAQNKLLISCEGTICTGGGNLTYQYTLQNVDQNPVVFTKFYVGTQDLDPTGARYSNWVAPAGFPATAIVDVWANLPGLSVMGTTGVQTAHTVIPPQSAVASVAAIVWTGAVLVNPMQTVTFGFDHPYDYQDMEWLAEHPDPTNLSFGILSSPIAGPLGVFTDGWIHGPSDHEPQLLRDYGDAPDGAMAYPSMGGMGQFPTCKGNGLFVEHNNFGAYFGPTVDFETDGNAGACPSFNPYDQDECFQDGDAGLIWPRAYTISTGVETPCSGSGGMLGNICQTAVWGWSTDIFVHNTMPNHEPYLDAYVNVLIDWNQDGVWNGSSTCPSGAVPEHVLVNFVVPAQYIGPLSNLSPPNFTIGPNPGYVWARFSITEAPVPQDWDGAGVFEDGESEDYLLLVGSGRSEAKWIQLPDLTPNGIDIKVDWDGDPSTDLILADDFLCTATGKLTDVHFWGSWKNDEKGNIINIHLSIHSDDPIGPGGTDPDNQYSKPDQLLWEMDFPPGTFTESLYYEEPDPGEYWWNPNTGELVPGNDKQVWRYDIDIDPIEAFVQDGSEQSPIIYWLDISVQDDTDAEFGWKTRRYPDHYNDDAVWDLFPGGPIWNELRYPQDHPLDGDSIDMAFVLTFEPPVPPVIPTMTQWGLAALFVLLALSAAWIIKRKFGQRSV